MLKNLTKSRLLIIVGLILLGIVLYSAKSRTPNKESDDREIISEENFFNPSNEYRPYTFWHWMNGNVTREGITADLEEMAEKGIGGVYLFIVEGKITESVPVYVDSPVRSLTPEWFEMLRHSASECKRLGLELSLMNCTGWGTSGGPWITPDKTMMRITWSEKYFKGSRKISEALPQPPADYANYQNLTKIRSQIHESVPKDQQFYKDVAILAYPLDPMSAKLWEQWPPELKSTAPNVKLINAIDGDGDTDVSINAMGYFQLTFDEFVNVEGIEYLGDECELQAMTRSGNYWEKVADLKKSTSGYPISTSISSTQAKAYRLFFHNAGTVKDLKFTGVPLVEDYRRKASFHSAWEDAKVAEDRLGDPTPQWVSSGINTDGILDITEYMKPNGVLEWNAPEGDWMVVRMGYAPIGKLNGPGAREFVGLESDKLDADAVEFHFNQYAGRVADELKDFIGNGFNTIHTDSWEGGDLNYTKKFREEFIKRRGYDLTPYLLVHGGGRVVGNAEMSERFLWDVRRTIADLLADNYFGKLNELSHERGLEFHGEIAGVMVQTTVDQLQVKGLCDVPMGEFQMPNWLYGEHWARWDSREAASGAHIHGKPVVAAEAFTGFDRWLTDPYALKGIGDLAFAMGINRLVFHTWALHPWEDKAPGMTMGPFGVNFSRMNTWWGKPAKAYLDYLRRCQYMLSQGKFEADILYFYGEGAPNTLPSKDWIRPILPEGYSYDGCDAGTISRLKVKDGKLYLPDGMNYKVLVLKDSETMTPELLEKIKKLIEEGATVIGKRPLRSPSLTNYPRSDQELIKLTNDIWNDIDGVKVFENSLGKGKVISGISVDEVLKSQLMQPDFEVVKNTNESSIQWIHRKTAGEHLYFVTNQQNMIEHGSSTEIWEMRYESYAKLNSENDAAQIEVAFRVEGMYPELWDPVKGTSRKLPKFRIENGRTIVPISLPPSGSYFIVFREKINSKQELSKESNFPKLIEVKEITGPWEVSFSKRWGGPGKVTFNQLTDWTDHETSGIKYFSGKATYMKEVNISEKQLLGKEKIYLDLGTLRNLAEVRLNGHDLGVLWCPPWRVEISGLLKPKNNILEIDIINVWANRLIGDAGLPDDQKISWSSLSDTRWKLKPEDRLISSGLYGPVRLLKE